MAIKGEMIGKYITGCNIQIPNLNIVIVQPSVKTILQFGENDFFEVINFIIQLETLLENMKKETSDISFLSGFHLLLAVYNEEPSMRQKINDFFNLTFPDYEVKITDNSIDFKSSNDNKIKERITPFNFEFLQNIVNELFLPQSLLDNETNYNPGSEQAAAIAEKLKKGRQKVAEQKKKEEDSSLFGTYLSVLTIGLQMDMNILMSYTPFQLYDLFMRYMAKTVSDQYFQISTIPFADTSKLEAPEEWTRNLYN